MKVNWPIVGLIGGCLALAGVVLGVNAYVSSTTEVGLGIPTVDLLGEPAFLLRHGSGTLDVAANGCFRLDTGNGVLFAIWPEGTTMDDDEIVLANGNRLATGEHLAGDFAVATAVQVVAAADGPDGYMDSVVSYCAPDAATVIVVNSLD